VCPLRLAGALICSPRGYTSPWLHLAHAVAILRGMTDIAALSRLLENLIRLGTVAEVDHGSLPDKRPAWVRVQSGDLLTSWLPWAALRAGTTRDWDPPTVGEQVLVLSPNGQTAQGVAIGSVVSAQVNPDGSPFEARRPRDLRGKKGRIRRRMFEKLKMARYLKAKGTPQQAVIGFTGRVSRIARVHQYGLKDRAEKDKPKVWYSRPELIGPNTDDARLSSNLVLSCLDN